MSTTIEAPFETPWPAKDTHTPGPWMADDGDTLAWGVFSSQDADAICYLSDCPEKGHGLAMRTNKENAANARLIAAAPELLAACWAARDYLLRFCSGDVAKSRYDQLCAAIDKV